MQGEIRLGSPVSAIEADEHRITAVRVDGQRIPCENLVWTGPLAVINQLLGIGGIS